MKCVYVCVGACDAFESILLNSPANPDHWPAGTAGWAVLRLHAPSARAQARAPAHTLTLIYLHAHAETDPDTLPRTPYSPTHTHTHPRPQARPQAHTRALQAPSPIGTSWPAASDSVGTLQLEPIDGGFPDRTASSQQRAGRRRARGGRRHPGVAGGGHRVARRVGRLEDGVLDPRLRGLHGRRSGGGRRRRGGRRRGRRGGRRRLGKDRRGAEYCECGACRERKSLSGGIWTAVSNFQAHSRSLVIF